MSVLATCTLHGQTEARCIVCDKHASDQAIAEFLFTEAKPAWVNFCLPDSYFSARSVIYPVRFNANRPAIARG